MEKIELKPIGFVSTKAVENRVRDRSNVSRIVLREDLAEALDGIEDFSHLFVIFWMNKIPIEQRRIMNVHPRGKDDAPLLGVFATRTSHRPNPIGLTLVELLDVDKNVIVVRGLDAFDNSPVLDIKPFDSWDRASNVKVPEWWIRMGEGRIGKTRDPQNWLSRKGETDKQGSMNSFAHAARVHVCELATTGTGATVASSKDMFDLVCF